MGSARCALTVGAALLEAVPRLEAAGCDQARLDAELLLAHVLRRNRAYVLAHPERCLEPTEEAAWRGALARRLEREPLAYILGRKEFYDLELVVDGRVLVPRPETELIVERVLALSHAEPVCTLWDVGTGSGALALTLARHLPGAHVVASDASPGALEVAALNRRRLGLDSRVQLVQMDLLAGAHGPIDVLVANLPYVETAEYCRAMPEVSRHEPRLALDGGADGLDLVARLLAQAAALEPAPRLILLEIGATQGSRALELARRHFPAARLALRQDLAGLDRVLEIEPPPFPSPPGGEGRGEGRAPSPPGGEGRVRGVLPLPRGERVGVRGGPAPKRAPQRAAPTVLPATPAGIALAAEALRRGEVVAFPTDTVYGVGAAIFQVGAIQALYEIKGRPEGKAIPLLLADARDLEQVAASVPPVARRLLAEYWPGPLTLVLEARPDVPAIVRADGPTVAVRVPDDAVARALIDAVGAPLATTSANRSGAPEALTAAEVLEQLGDGVKWVVDGGPSRGGRPSTVVDVTVEPPAITRVGAIPAEMLQPLLSQRARPVRRER